MPLRRSLAQDDVDWCNNTVAFIFLLLLGFFALLVLPLTPTLDFNGNGQVASGSSMLAEFQKRPTTPKVSLTCWGPAQFMDLNHVRYMDTYCSEEMKRKLSGEGPRSGIFTVNDILKPPRSSYSESKGTKSKSSNGQDRPADDDMGVIEKQKRQHQQRLTKNEQVKKKLRDLVYFKAPLVFLLVAFLLEAAHVLCSMMRNALPSCVNVDQILDTCVGSRSLRAANQTQILEETVEEVSESVKRSRNTTSVSYLASKTLNTIIVLVAVCYIGGILLADVSHMKQDLTEEKSSELGPLTDGKGNGSTSRRTLVSTDNVVHCFFNIIQKSNEHSYTVQCAVNEAGEEENSQSLLDIEVDPKTKNVLCLYQALFSVSLAFLVVLLVVNVINTTSWAQRLYFKSNVPSLGLPSNVATDVVLLVNMAQLNAGPTIARRLASSFVWSDGAEEVDREPILEVESKDD